jgi:hypothetical protein
VVLLLVEHVYGMSGVTPHGRSSGVDVSLGGTKTCRYHILVVSVGIDMIDTSVWFL